MSNTVKRYAEYLDPDARGFSTFLKVVVVDGRIVDAWLDGENLDENPYGPYKSASAKYNQDMFEESGTYYRDAARQLERNIVFGFLPLDRVKGARVLTQDARVLLDKIMDQMILDEQTNVGEEQ